MAWPTVVVDTTDTDADTDSPLSARQDLLDMEQKVNQMIAHVSAFIATLLGDADASAAQSTLGISAFIKTLLDAADAAGARATLDVPSNAQTILKTLIDAAGDLIYGTANDTPARLALGTARQFLRVNAGLTAPEWNTIVGADFGNQNANFFLAGPVSGGAAAPAFRAPVGADGASWVLLASAIASNSASLAFTSIPNGTYDEFVFVGDNILPATDATGLNLLMSVDNGSTYETAAASYQYANKGHVTDNTAADNNSTGATVISIGGTGIENTTAGGGISFEARLHNPASINKNKQMSWRAVNANSASSTFTSTTGVGIGISSTLTNNDVDAVKFQMGSGNIASGVIYLYGVRKT